MLLSCNPPAEQLREDQLRVTRPGATALVAVYSRSGNTARVGRALAETLGADYLRLRGKGGEGDGFFSTPRAFRPTAVDPPTVDLAPYRLVLLGAPIWYWRPSAVATSFLAALDLRGKKVVLFFTYQGGVWKSGLARWQKLVEDRGGQVAGVISINRKKLARGETEESQSLAQLEAQRAGW
jgi:hypothetical protein